MKALNSSVLLIAFLGTMLCVTVGCNRSSQSYPQSTHVKPLTRAAFDAEVKQSDVPVVVDFYAVWCGPCKIQAPVLDKLAEEMSGRVKFVQVDVDQEQELAQQFEIKAIPTLLVFNKGEVVEKFVGMTPADTLKVRLEGLAAAR